MTSLPAHSIFLLRPGDFDNTVVNATLIGSRSRPSFPPSSAFRFRPLRVSGELTMAPILRMLGSPRRCPSGLTRRETLAAGALTFLGGGFDLPSLLAAESAAASAGGNGAGYRGSTGSVRPAKAKNVIVLYLLGGA